MTKHRNKPPAWLLVIATLLCGPAFGQVIATETQKLIASDGGSDDTFGIFIALDGNVAIIGARDDDDNGTDSGSAYVYTFDGGRWSETEKLVASDGASNDGFGRVVAIGGNTAIVGASGDDDNGDGSGSAYVYTFDGMNWAETQKLMASDGAELDFFGGAVAIDGNTAIVGAAGDDDNGSLSGSAYVYTFDGAGWRETQKLTPTDGSASDRFGFSIAIDGNVAIIGARDDNGTGSAYIYTFDGTRWVETQRLAASDGTFGNVFGETVAVSGDTAIVGASRDNENGFSSGSAYVFTFDGASWRETQKLTASDGLEQDQFGRSVAIDGTTVVVGAFGDDGNGPISGATYVYAFDGMSWAETQRIAPADLGENALFGFSVALNGDTTIVGAPRDDERSQNRGSVYVYALAEPSSQTAIRIEAEDMRLDTFRIEERDFASGDALINLKGPGFNGSATTAFAGTSGLYDLIVVYHDENDGDAMLTVSVAGIPIDSWTLDRGVPGGRQAETFNRFSRQVATGIVVSTGDEIAIDAVQGNWDHANVDYIELVLREPSQPQDRVRIEAENMQLATYRVEVLDFASGRALINLKGPGDNGSATTTFNGASGSFDVFVAYHDENDGQAMLTVTIGGVSLDSWVLDQRFPGGQQPMEFNRVTRRVGTSVTISTGDEIRIEGLQGNWDNANVDYIEFVEN